MINTTTPLVDIYENESEFLIVADVPGVTNDQVKLHLDDGSLELEAADYRRGFQLPDGIDYDKTAADLKDGVLSIRIPKLKAATPRQIAVKAS